MKPGKPITFLLRQKKTWIFTFNTTVLVIASFVAGYNMQHSETTPSTTLVVRLTSDYITGAREKFLKAQASLDTMSLNVPFIPPPSDEEPLHHTEKLKTVVIEPPPEPVIQEQTKAALPAPKKPVKHKKTEREVGSAKTSTVKKRSWSNYTDVLYTVEKGETVSHFVRQRSIRDFVAYNKNLTHPDRIYAGKTYIIKLPTEFVSSAHSMKKRYMNDYVITTATGSSGREIFRLKKETLPTEPETLLSLLIKKGRRSITKSTIPYLNLSEFTNSLAKQRDSSAIASNDFSFAKITGPRMKRPLLFKTDLTNKTFNKNHFSGFKSLDYLQFNHNTNAIKDFIRQLTRNRGSSMAGANYHFLIFGETLVQTRYLEKEIFRPYNVEPVVHIGVVHQNTDTRNTLEILQRGLIQTRVKSGTLEIITAQNMPLFFN